jgi:hypothetical protein
MRFAAFIFLSLLLLLPRLAFAGPLEDGIPPRIDITGFAQAALKTLKACLNGQ